jgi:hypothetical protein
LSVPDWKWNDISIDFIYILYNSKLDFMKENV